MRAVFRIVKWAGLVLLALVIVAVVAVSYRLWVALPTTSGTVKVSGVSGPVEVLRDEFGVPHIRAASAADAMFGQGYVHAQDRLWQMEFQRRLAAGRLAEILGEPALSTDRLFRTLGLYRAAERDWPTLSPGGRALVEAYVAGVNAFLAAHRGRQLPVEFAIFGYEPSPWTPADVTSWPKVMALTLSTNFRDELLRARIVGRAGADVAEALMPAWGAGWPLILPEGLAPAEVAPGDLRPTPAATPAPAARLDVPLAERIAAISATIPASPFAASTPAASNNWVVSGARTASGRPLLANDPHLGARLPSTWYLAHVEGGGLNAIGATLPGVPGVVIGHNTRIAWGLTNLMTDVQDLYVERLNGRGEAEYEGEWEPLRVVHDVIRVKGRPDVPLRVRSTRHGPILTDALEDGPAEALALRWVALDEGDTTLDAFLGASMATTWEEFTVALSRYRVPTQNWVYADVDGNIGYFAPGLIPVRAAGDGTVPVPGWTRTYEWTGFVPPEQWPRIYNPTRGYVVTANNKALPDSYPFLISTNWEPGYRAQRITQLIEPRSDLTANDMAAIQADVSAASVGIVLPWMRRVVVPADDAVSRTVYERLRGWDGTLRADSVEASIYMHWYRRLVRGLFEDELGDDLWREFAQYEHWHGKAVHRLVTTSDDSWCDDRRTPATESCESLLASALSAAIADMRAEYGTDDIGRWTWGRANVVAFPHLPFDAVPALRRFFSRRFEHPGNTFSVSPTMRIEDQTIIASYREIVDLASFDESRWIHPLGQSGQPFSAHYDDFHQKWRRVEYVPMRFSRDAVDRATRATLRLVP